MSTSVTGAAERHPEITKIVLSILDEIAPGLEADDIDPSVDMRYELEIDSIDFLNLMIGIDERLEIDIPESDSGQLVTLDGLVDYLVANGAADRV